MTKLKPKHEAFVQEYVKTLNGRQAAIFIGLSEKTADQAASRLLKNVKVRARLDELLEKQSEKHELTVDKILKDIEECRIKCMQGIPVLDREGKETGEWKFESHAALKASELQGKYKKMWTEKVEHSGSIEVTALSDDSLNNRIKELLKKVK